MSKVFSCWESWANRSALAALRHSHPGVYAIAISPSDISGTGFSWPEEIVYFGMTIAKGGLKSRLQQFDKTIKGEEGFHGGGFRVRHKHSDYATLKSQLYVSVCSWDWTSIEPSNLRIMGEVAKHEYECFAVFFEKFRQMPEFNDKKKSPKR